MKNWLKQNRGFVIFLVCLGLFRTAMADWNPVPPGSMRPTILEGDVVLVNRLAYDVKLPLTNITLGRLGVPKVRVNGVKSENRCGATDERRLPDFLPPGCHQLSFRGPGRPGRGFFVNRSGREKDNGR